MTDDRSSFRRNAAEAGAGCTANRRSPIVNRQRSGIALVLTLILLSVTLVMAVAFLAISRRERGSVATSTDTATARLAADSALSRAQAQIVANMLTGGVNTNGQPVPNPYNFGLLVSTNYINPEGFLAGVSSFTNVNYYYPNGSVVAGADFDQLLTNLYYLPRAPVLISTNEPAGRYYLDLNRNGRFDTNGYFANLVTNSSGALVTNNTFSVHVGDPEWIGVLEHPDQPYGPDNMFIARYAFIAVPIGNALDLNYIHNQVFDERNADPTVNPPQNSTEDNYFRNQGVGSWEMNLSAFLADLNTNQWGRVIGNSANGNTAFYYYQYPVGGNRGVAFDDARALLAYRYGNNYNFLKSVNAMYGGPLGPGRNAFIRDNVDGYSDGILQTTISPPPDIVSPIVNDDPSKPWAGADSTNQFFDLTSDLFDLNKTARGVSPAQVAANNDFTARMENAGTGGATYDRYTFYRLLSQLGTDSTPESGLINLNYSNAFAYFNANGVVTNISIFPGAQTNFVPWTPIQFFTIAADKLLRAYSAQWATAYTNDANNFLVPGVNTNFVATFNVTNAFGITDIPVWVSNRFVYTPAVNRLLQLAANIYDATTTNFYPTIFRPMFMHTNGNVFIVGYEQQTNYITQSEEMAPSATPDLAPPVEIADLLNNYPEGVVIQTNVYGVPWIIGARKGFPNFNEFSTESAFDLTRKLELQRDLTTANQPDITWTNQMYLMNITNYFGVEFWNSYRSNYLGAGTVNPGLVDVMVRFSSAITFTNDAGMAPYYYYTNIWLYQETNLWHGWDSSGQQQIGKSSFIVPLNTAILALTNVIYYYNNGRPRLLYAGDSPSNYLDKGIEPLPHFYLLTTNRLQVAVIDYSAGINRGRIIDYVQLGGLNSSRELNSELDENAPNSFWNTNYDANGNLIGVYNQILMSEYGSVNGQTPIGPGIWSDQQINGGPSDPSQPGAQQAFFRGFFAADGKYVFDNKIYYNQESAVQAPYTPSAFGVQYQTWQANDPLVHYLASDLVPLGKGSGIQNIVNWPENLGQVNQRYSPWGKVPPSYESGVDQNANNLAYKDPLVRSSDSWDFPTNKLATIGWLGRIHRGTPWQSVYLKSTNVLNLLDTTLSGTVIANGITTWLHWTGDGNLFDASCSAPTQDRLLFDLFTTSFNDNAARGQLSVNTPAANLADWSALFSGMEVLSNNVSDLRIRFNPQTENPPPPYTNLVINPAGPAGPNAALSKLVESIGNTRATFTNNDGLVGAFEHKGDILAVPQLSEQSPFLNWINDLPQQTNGISDEMYEWLPQEMMSLVRLDSEPRYVIYSYGQALKPAANAMVTAGGSDFFGLITNYQVVSEMDTRTVIRVEGAPTNTHAVIESFNILPPN